MKQLERFDEKSGKPASEGGFMFECKKCEGNVKSYILDMLDSLDWENSPTPEKWEDWTLERQIGYDLSNRHQNKKIAEIRKLLD